MSMRRFFFIIVILFLAGLIFAEDSMRSEALIVDPPTLICLGFQWRINGDDNENGVCEIHFREKGNSEWKRGMDLFRTNGEKGGTDKFTPPAYITPNAFGGSLFDLKPDTEYEVRLTLKDPDGVDGEAEKMVTVKTRHEPMPSSDGKVLTVGPDDVKRIPIKQMAKVIASTPLPEVSGEVMNVVPDGLPYAERSKIENNRNGLLHAFYGYAMYCDWSFDPDRVQPGETIAMQPGVYASNRMDYRVSQGYSLWFHGTHFLGQSGTAENPIIIKAAEGAEVVFDGLGCDTLFDVTHADYLVFEGITIRNCCIGFKAGDLSRGAKGLRFINCKFENVDTPIYAANDDCVDYQISGNMVDGEASGLIDPEAVIGFRDMLWEPGEIEPGTIVKLKAGKYNIRREGDADDGPWVHGTFAIDDDGTVEKPIVITTAGDGPVVIDGGGCDTLFDVRESEHLYFEGLQFKNAKVTLKAGIQFLNGTQSLTVKQCKFEDVGYGVLATSGECRDFYIADNHMRCWKVNKIKGQVFDREYGYGFNLLGTGHVACYNDVSNFWDNMNVCTNGHGDPAVGRPAISIDIYNNVGGRSGDNNGEADGSVRNVRFMRNRASFTCQPLRGGPVYFIRNLSEPLKYAEHPSGAVVLHNNLGTLNCKGGKHSFLNNRVAWSWKPQLLLIETDVKPGTLDGNAYNLMKGGKIRVPEKWVLKTGKEDLTADSFEGIQKAGYETHGFTYEGDDSALVDKAILIPNVNDDYAGDGPDIGPVEHGKPEPHYGPRDK